MRRMLDELGPSGQTLIVRVNRLEETGLTGEDLEGLRAAARQAMGLGYTGMHLIHP